jgi:2-haloacid dehalogenase
MIEAVVFDLGGVLADWDREHLYRKLIPDPAERRRFLDQVVTMEFNAELDRGAPFDETVARLVERFPAQADLITAYRDRWEEMLPGDFATTVAILSELVDSGVRCYALTNWSAETFPLAEARFPWLELFTGIVVSGREGMVKPEAAIFSVLSERHQLTPARTVVVDDSPGNVEAAAALGFEAIHFVDAIQLRRDLRRLGLPLSP